MDNTNLECGVKPHIFKVVLFDNLIVTSSNQLVVPTFDISLATAIPANLIDNIPQVLCNNSIVLPRMFSDGTYRINEAEIQWD